MAMLAENKKKQKWSHDPRNTTWSNDTNRFGYQLMTKMGWKSGKGLGARENGQTSHIKALKRKTNIGLGADQSNDDSWLAHQEAFNDLLSHLNDVNQNGDDGATEDTKYDMEKKARESRKRVFYNRFIKSKDTSAYSQTDMACILGQRSKSAPATPVEQSEDSDSDGSTASCPTTVKTLTSHGVTTINTGQNIQEYFAKKMQELQTAKCKDSEAVTDKETCGDDTAPEDTLTRDCGDDTVPTAEEKSSVDHDGSESVDSQKEKKKKKKRKRKLIEDVLTSENEAESFSRKRSSSKSKKKRKDDEKGEKHSTSPRKTKNKKKKKKANEAPTNQCSIENESSEQDESVKVNRKRNKRIKGEKKRRKGRTY